MMVVGSAVGWGQLLYGNNSSDPEPGRCRRTDGKKWRCSRDVVPDHKYCERHMHRGKHRAKKTTVPAASTPQLHNNNSTKDNSSAAASVTNAKSSLISACLTHSSSGTKPNSIPDLCDQQHRQQQIFSDNGLLSMARGFTNVHNNQDDRMVGQQAFFTSVRPHTNTAGEESQAISGLSVLSSTSLHAAGDNILGLPCMQQSKQGAPFTGGRDRYQCQPGLRHFFDDWPVRSREATNLPTGSISNTKSISKPWSNYNEETRASASNSSTTQLSISIPTIQANSSISSPRSTVGMKLGLPSAALKLSMSMQANEEDPLQVGSQLMIDINQEHHLIHHAAARHHHSHHEHDINSNISSWIPIAWEPSPDHEMAGGPLAEVLQSSNNSPRSMGCKDSCLNLMNDAWEHHDHSSPHNHHHDDRNTHINVASSSPTGIFHINHNIASSDNSTACHNSPSNLLSNSDKHNGSISILEGKPH